MNPCTNCKRKPCPERCIPKADYQRHLAREKRKAAGKLRQKLPKCIVGVALVFAIFTVIGHSSRFSYEESPKMVENGTLESLQDVALAPTKEIAKFVTNIGDNVTIPDDNVTIPDDDITDDNPAEEPPTFSDEVDADYTPSDAIEEPTPEFIPERGYIPSNGPSADDVDYILRVLTAEGGSDYLICAGVTQCLFNSCEADGWNRSIVQILHDYGYTGPASWISDAAETAYDQIFCSGYRYTDFEDARYFYSTRYCYSAWHETLRFVTEVGGVRFFATWD